MYQCVFCEIVAGKTPADVVWEDKKYLAFLSIFPNTEGLTVVIPKKHYESYAFNLPDEVLQELILVAKKVGKLLDRTFEDVGRTALIIEGFGVNHVHAKLIPLHGTGNLHEWKPIKANIDTFFEKYQGYVSSHNSKRADDKELAQLAQKIRSRGK